MRKHALFGQNNPKRAFLKHGVGKGKYYFACSETYEMVVMIVVRKMSVDFVVRKSANSIVLVCKTMEFAIVCKQQLIHALIFAIRYPLSATDIILILNLEHFKTVNNLLTMVVIGF